MSSKLTLHGTYKSSCSARVRIALAHKNIPCNYEYVDYAGKQHKSDKYAKMNPSKSVPTLVVESDGNLSPSYIAQSVAALEYLDEAYPDSSPLLPPASDSLARAQVRALVQIVCADVQPVTNNRITDRVKGWEKDWEQWNRDWHDRGLKAYEDSIKATAGHYSFGDKVTMADVCLAPMVWNAHKVDMDLNNGSYPTVARVYKNLMELPAFRNGHWKMQPDCPEEER